MTTTSDDFTAIIEALDASGLSYTHIDPDTDNEVVIVPGYGTICWDSQAGVEAGFFVRVEGPGTASFDDPVTESELLRDIAALAEDVDERDGRAQRLAEETERENELWDAREFASSP